MSEIKVRLVLTGSDISPEEISNYLDASPSVTWRSDERVHPKSSKTYGTNGWALIESDSGDAASAELLFEKIQRRVSFEKLIRLVSDQKGIDVELSVVLYIDDSVPTLGLNTSQVQYLAKIGAEIDVDIYPLSDQIVGGN